MLLATASETTDYWLPTTLVCGLTVTAATINPSLRSSLVSGVHSVTVTPRVRKSVATMGPGATVKV